MTGSTDARLARLLALLPWLRAHPGVDVATAARHFAITPEQLQEDISLLWFCGLPGLAGGDLIDVEYDGDGIRVLDAQTLDRPLRLTADEGVALLAAARALRELPGLVDVATLDAVVAKLSQAVVGAGLDGAAAGVDVSLRLTDAPGDDAVLGAVRRGLAEGRRLRMRYHVERRDEMTERVLDPLELRLLEGRAYLIAWDAERGATRTFRVDRIDSVDVTDEPAAAPADATVAPTAGRFTSSPDDVSVTLALQPRARWVADYYPVESTASQDDGSVRVVLRTGDAGWIARLVVRLGGAAAVLEPASVAEQVRATARAGLAAYDAGSAIG